MNERNTEQRGRRATLGYPLDITEQKRTQQREKRLNLLLRIIVDVHRVIAKERDVTRLIKGICHCLTKARGYWNAWIALLDESNKLKNIAACRMHKNLRLMIERMRRGELPKCAEVALTQAKAVVIADPLSVCAGCPLYDDECAMTVRLEHAGKVYGLLTVAVTKDLITHPDEQTLVQELGEDIAFALFRIELEENLKSSEEKYRSLIHNIPDVTWTSDENYGIVFVSPNVKDVSGYTQEEEYQIGNWAAWFDRIHPDDVERAKATFRELIKGRKHYDIEYRLKRKNGRWVWIHERSLGTYKRDGKLYSDGVLTDITERKQMEEALRESEKFSSTLLARSPNPILVTNPDTSIRYVNPALEKLTGFSSSELVGTQAPYPWCLREIPGEDVSTLGVEVEALYQKKNRERFWVEVNALPVMSNGELKYCVSNWVDTTEQKRLREDLQFYITEIIKAQEEERKRIAREIHDETAQALAMVCADCEEVLVTRKGISDETTERLKQLRGRLKSILGEIRQLSHDLRPSLLDQFGLIPSLELLIKEANARGGIDCRMEMITSERRIAHQAEVALFRIVQEALRNARKHSKATKAVVSVEFDKQQVKVSIRDNGIGFKLPTALSSLARHSKLGLMGMQERARILGGNLKIESQAGKGTTITVSIPA